MKTLLHSLFLLPGLLFFSELSGQGIPKIVIDTSAVLSEAVEGAAISRRELMENGWVHVQTDIQHFNHYGDEGPFYEEIEEYNYVYYFKESGDFEIDAILDTDGTWKYDEEKHHLQMKSNFRDYLDKDCILYKPEEGKLIWYENFNEDPDNVMFFIYTFEAKE